MSWTDFDINQIKDYDDVTAAHIACSSNSIEVLYFLIQHEADFFNAKDRWGNTPYARAQKAGNERIITILDKLQADLLANQS